MHDQELVQEENNLIAVDPNHNVQVPVAEAVEKIPATQPRRSTRGSRPPIWIKDYVCPVNGAFSSNCIYPMSGYLNYSALSATYQSYLAATSHEP